VSGLENRSNGATLTIVRGVLAGLAGGLAWLIGLTIFFGPAQRILADPNRQSEKFLRVFSEIEPLPRTLDVSVLIGGLLLIGTIHGLVYAFLSSRLPGGVLRRGLTFGVIAWALMTPWFEFYLPWNVMHEPMPLVVLEGVLWLLVQLLVGVTIATVYAACGRILRPQT
jgi:hypothetical protein